MFRLCVLFVVVGTNGKIHEQNKERKNENGSHQQTTTNKLQAPNFGIGKYRRRRYHTGLLAPNPSPNLLGKKSLFS